MFELFNILLIESDPLIGSKLRAKFKTDRFNLNLTGCLSTAKELDSAERHDIYIVNMALPDGNPLEFVRTVSKRKDRPVVIVIMDEPSVSRSVEAFRYGADDVLSKPVHYSELIARLRAVLKRSKRHDRSKIVYGDICLDLEARCVTYKNELLALSAKEFGVLKILLKNPGFIFSKAQLEEKIYQWGGDVGSNTIEVHISHLRKKLGKNLITTYRNMGYTIKVPSQGSRQAISDAAETTRLGNEKSYEQVEE